MSVIAVLGGLTKYGKTKKANGANIANTIFRLHRLSTALLICCSLLTTAKQLFGEQIHCMNSGQVPLKMFEAFCFMSATYSLPPETGAERVSASRGVYAPSNTRHTSPTHHNYYQWVSLLLVFQAVCCYLPWGVWKAVEGGKVAQLVKEISTDPLSTTPLPEQVKSLGDFLHDHSGWFNWAAVKLLLGQVSCLVLTVTQMYAMDLVLGNKFLQLGTNILQWKELPTALETVFPLKVVCDMDVIGPSGTVVKEHGLCTLPVNIINEKIYLVIWLWFVLLSLVTLLCLLHQLLLLMLPYLRQAHLARRADDIPDHLVRGVIRHATYGDFVLLALLADNMEPAQFTALLSHLTDQPRSFLHQTYRTPDERRLASKGGVKEV